MKKHGFCKLVLFLLCVIPGTNLCAQQPADSADIYYRHLELNEIVVTTPVGQMKRKQASAPVEVIMPGELRHTQSTNIVDAIAHKPGISQVKTGNGISKPVIRGLGYNRIVTIADGVRQEGQQWGDEHGLELDGSAVGQVEVLKGPASLIYGSDAMAGVVIFHPEPMPSEGTIAAEVQTEYQTNSGLADYSLRIGGRQRGTVWRARWTQRAAHAYHAPVEGYVPGTQFYEHSLSGLVGINREWGFSHLTLSAFNLTPGLTEGERDSITGELVCDYGNPRTYCRQLPFQRVGHYKAVWDNSFTLGDGTLKAVLGYQHNRRREYEDEEEAELDFRLHTLTYDLRYSLPLPHDWRLTAGAGGMYQRSLNEADEVLIPAYNLTDIGVYATAQKTIKSWTLNGGLRYDLRHLHSHALAGHFHDFTRNFNGLTGSLGAVVAVGSHFNIRANLARGFRAPNMSELGSNGVHEGTLRYEIGNSRLDPEYSLQGDLGIDYSSRFFSAQLAIFANRIDNYIFAARLSDASVIPEAQEEGLDVFRYTQATARLMGFEAGVDIHPIHQLHLASTLSMVDARQRQPEHHYLPLTPAPRLTADITWEFLHNGDHHNDSPHHVGENKTSHHRIDHVFDNAFVSVGVEYNFEQNHFYDVAQTETATPAYTLLSAKIGSDILLRGGRKLCEIVIIGDNLLNCAYQSHLSRLKYVGTNPVSGRRGINNPGRNITLRVVFPIDIIKKS